MNTHNYAFSILFECSILFVLQKYCMGLWWLVETEREAADEITRRRVEEKWKRTRFDHKETGI